MSYSCFIRVFAGLLVVMVAVMLKAKSTSALPIGDVEDLEEDKRSMLLAKYMTLMNRERELRENSPLNPDFDQPDPLASSYIHKRGSKKKNKSGGMSLCLWKVCPAAPWLQRF